MRCIVVWAEDGPKPSARAVADMNVAWLNKALAKLGVTKRKDSSDRASAIYAAVIGAQLIARSRNNLPLFDRVIDTYRSAGLIP